jgi:hypothetical protein
MHAQQGQDVLLNQLEVVNASPTTACQQGTNTQMGTTKRGVDITRAGNGTWSSDMPLKLLDLPYDSANYYGHDKDPLWFIWILTGH